MDFLGSSAGLQEGGFSSAWARRLGLLGLCATIFSGCQLFQSSKGQDQSTTFAGGSKRAELSCAREGAERVDLGSWRGSGRPDVARVYLRNPDGKGPPVLSCREV